MEDVKEITRLVVRGERDGNEASMGNWSELIGHRNWTSAAFILGTAALLVGLPVAVWLDLRGVSDRMLLREAEEIRRIINDINDYFGREIVAKLHRQLDEAEVRGRETVLMPPMMSPELGRVISSQDGTTRYRFVSDLPGAAPTRPFREGSTCDLAAEPDGPGYPAVGLDF
jgi:adenylate cyclase